MMKYLSIADTEIDKVAIYCWYWYWWLGPTADIGNDEVAISSW